MDACLTRFAFSDFFKPAAWEPPSPFFTPEKIGRLHRAHLDARSALDDQTWRDLLLESWEERLAQDTSIFGRQMLHRRLRAGLDDADCAALTQRLRGLLATQPLGWMATLAALAPLMALQVSYHRRLESWDNTLGSLNALLAGGHALAELGGPLLEPFVEARSEAARLHKRVGHSLALRMIPACMAYPNWFGAYNISHYWKTTRAVRRARLPALPVRASMQNEDSLLGGESLYMSELRRARELLAASGEPAGICLIDEVFRGTNHLESVSAASALLESLCERDLVLVSSHNLMLARILAGKLEPFRIDTAGGCPVLQPGVLREPNGIALLAIQGFGARIEGRAAEVARWLSAHLDAQPDEQEQPEASLHCAIL